MHAIFYEKDKSLTINYLKRVHNSIAGKYKEVINDIFA
jgi:hypothetical protein